MVKIATHNGQFHADEILACAFLNYIHNRDDANFEIVRTRLPEAYSHCDYIVDVGKEYDPSVKKFDHHFEFKFYFDDEKNQSIPMSSVGMVYKSYGRQMWTKFITKSIKNIESETIEKIVPIVFNNFYYEVLREIDAIDNGIFNPPPIKTAETVTYNIYMTLTSMLSKFNQFDNNCMGDEQDKAFRRAMHWAWTGIEAVMDFMLKKEMRFFNLESSLVSSAEILYDGRVVFFNSSKIKSLEKRILYGMKANPIYIAYREDELNEMGTYEYVIRSYDKKKAIDFNSIAELKNFSSFIHHTGFIAKTESRQDFDQFLLNLFK